MGTQHPNGVTSNRTKLAGYDKDDPYIQESQLVSDELRMVEDVALECFGISFLLLFLSFLR